MHRAIAVVLLIWSVGYSISPAPPVKWISAFDNVIVRTIHDVEPLPDGGYIAVGEATASEQEPSRCVVVRVSAAGSIEWSRAFNYGDSSGFTRVKRLVDGSLVIAGTYRQSGCRYAVVQKLFADGSESWRRTVEECGATSADIGVTPDGFMLVTNNPLAPEEIALHRISSDGEIVQQWRFGTPGVDVVSALHCESDGRSVLVGSTSLIEGGSMDGFVLGLDSAGSVRWAQVLGDALHDDSVLCIDAVGPNRYVVAGVTSSTGIPLSSNAFVAALDSASVSWAALYGGEGSESVCDIFSTGAGGFVLAGSTGSVSDEQHRQAFILQGRIGGDVEWLALYGTDFEDKMCTALSPSAQGGYAIGGTVVDYLTNSTFCGMISLGF